jgi:hypothetical protein
MALWAGAGFVAIPGGHPLAVRGGSGRLAVVTYLRVQEDSGKNEPLVDVSWRILQ